MARVILFTAQMEKMTEFYRDIIGLKQVSDEPGWREFDAGGRADCASFRAAFAR